MLTTYNAWSYIDVLGYWFHLGVLLCVYHVCVHVRVFAAMMRRACGAVFARSLVRSFVRSFACVFARSRVFSQAGAIPDVSAMNLASMTGPLSGAKTALGGMQAQVGRQALAADDVCMRASVFVCTRLFVYLRLCLHVCVCLHVLSTSFCVCLSYY
jgi:hypothetical protein